VSDGRRCGDAAATREGNTGCVLDGSEPAGGVVVVSLWWEEAAGTWSLRGRVTSTPQLGSARSVSTAVADIDSVLAAVREGVEAFMARPPGTSHG
jgi:hypothetical protein